MKKMSGFFVVLLMVVGMVIMLPKMAQSDEKMDHASETERMITSLTEQKELDPTLAGQLSARITTIRQLDDATATDYLQDFIQYIKDPSILQQNLITNNAVEKLERQVNSWINSFNGADSSFDPSNEEYKVYDWLSQMQLPNGLLESAENGNMVSLYDNSLAAIIFTENGDYDKAEKIFDFFVSRIENEFEVGGKGFGQFRDREGVPLNNTPNRWLGDNAWLLIALNNYHEKTNSDKYAKLTQKLETWIRSLQDEDGGLWGGFNEGGQQIAKNTEGILDAFIAVPGYDDFHKGILTYLEQNRYNPETKLLKATEGKYQYPLDLFSWGYSMLEDFPVDSLFKANLAFTSQTMTANGQEVFGYSFDRDCDTIWGEGTGQMAVAYNIAGFKEQGDFIISQMEKMMINSETFSGTKGIPYASNMGTGYGDGPLWEGVDTNIVVSSSVWYLLAKTNVDPYQSGREKNIPAADKFY